MNLSRCVARLVTAGIMLVGASHVNASVYTFFDLGTLDFEEKSYAYSINNSEQMAGPAFTSMGSTAVRWDGTTPTILDSAFGSQRSHANGINSSGQVVGWSFGSNEQPHATLWNGTKQTILGGLSGGGDSQATAINNAGLVVGHSKDRTDNMDRATMWTQNGVTALANLEGATGSEATGVNSSGHITGNTNFGEFGETTYATKWANGQVEKLVTLPGTLSSYAYSINDVGQVAGHSVLETGTAHATLWNGSTATDLGTLGGDFSTAWAVNNAGQVVGWATDQNYNNNYITRAVLWNGNNAVDLNDYLDPSRVQAGWVLTAARGINDRGSIVGLSYNIYSGTENAFLLSTVSPVPEPEAYMMLLIGLSVIGFMIWRKRERSAVGTGALMAI